MIDVHYWPTPNGKKVTILLEECDLDYRIVSCSIGQGDQSYALRRFSDEVNRLYGVMNNRLYDRHYLAGGEYTIADMISYPWTAGWEAQGEDLEAFRYFKRWFDELSARTAVQRGMDAGSDLSADYSKLGKDDIKRLRALLYNQRARPAPSDGML